MLKTDILKSYLERYRALPFHYCDDLKQMTWEINLWQKQRILLVHPNLFSVDAPHALQQFFFSHFYNFDILEMLANQLTEALRQKIKLDRWLPTEVLDTILQGFNLALITLEQDLQLAQLLRERNLTISNKNLFSILKDTQQYPSRQQQLLLLQNVSKHLNKFAHSFLLRSAFKLARHKLCERGFEELYHYVDEGFQVMRQNQNSLQFFLNFSQQEDMFLNYLMQEQPSDLIVYYDVDLHAIQPFPPASKS